MVSIDLIKELREITGISISECKKALEEAGGDMEKAKTQATIEVEVCSACHPFYTGQDKLMDKVGRVQKFRERLAQKQTGAKKVLASSAKRADAADKKTQSVQKGSARVTTKKPARASSAKTTVTKKTSRKKA